MGAGGTQKGGQVKLGMKSRKKWGGKTREKMGMRMKPGGAVGGYKQMKLKNKRGRDSQKRGEGGRLSGDY